VAKYPNFTGAACREGQSLDLFFPLNSSSGPGRQQAEEAKQVCRGCVKRLECLTWALERPEQHGIWGGMDEDERDATRKRRNRLRFPVAAAGA
jgi:WhiB family redox-sensing transcriptional regulator